MPAPTSFHPGELAAQEARGYADDVWGRYESMESGLDDFMALFFSQLSFLSVTVLDAARRPWTSILSGRGGNTGFIQRVKSEDDKLRFECEIALGDPMREVLHRLKQRLDAGQTPYEAEDFPREEFLIAAVGVMLHNRRRNKMEGVIVDVERVPDGDRDSFFTFIIETSNTFGNCPKYINTRTLEPCAIPSSASSSLTLIDVVPDEPVPAEILSIISQADLAFLGTRHSAAPPGRTYLPDPPRLGNNCRGGRRGFLRTYWDSQRRRTCVFLPDWSGNRIMQSLGNMTTDHVAGLSIPIWGKGDRRTTVLHLTCDAEVLAGDDARKLMRGVDGASLLWITGYSLVRSSLPLAAASQKAADAGGGGFQKLQSLALGGVRSHTLDADADKHDEDEGEEAAVGWSPYNPPLRTLLSETAAGATQEEVSSPPAHLVDVRFHSPLIATFVWRASIPTGGTSFRFQPGQHVVMDMFESLDTRVKLYAHMASFKGGEKDLNDDGVRSWTMSRVRRVAGGQDGPAEEEWEFETTLRRKQRGGVTPGLFSRGLRALEDREDSAHESDARKVLLSAPLLAVEGGLTLPLALFEKEEVNLTYLVSGIGMTPLLAHLNHLVELLPSKPAHVNVRAVIGVRYGEIGVVTRLVKETLHRLEGKQLRVMLHLLVSAPSSHLDEADADDDYDQANATTNSSLKVDVHPLRRLSATSFVGGTGNDASQASDSPYSAFHLSDEDERRAVTQSDYILLCASKPFERVARTALSTAGISKDRIHTESFNF